MIYAPKTDFDWAVFVEDNQNNRSLLGETSLMNKLMRRFEATMKKKKYDDDKDEDTKPNFRHGLPCGHPA